MKLETVESDAIHAIGYDDEVRVLELIFNNGGIYQYRGVPREVFEQLLRAESKGRFFQDNIRDEFEYWQWDAELAKFIRAEQKSAPGALQGDA
jgi:hypothetical protein